MKELLWEPHPACTWVFRGEGTATRKYDGTCCLIKNSILFKRREVKKGKTLPINFEQIEYDPVTEKAVGWVPVTKSKEDRWHIEAFGDAHWPDGTYELCGLKVQGNPEEFENHILIPHANAMTYDNITRTFEGIKEFLEKRDIEGLVFHNLDGRMAKIKKRDYGLPRKPARDIDA